MTLGARLSFVTFCFVATISAFGATWYASPNGAVDAECTAEAPGTIQAAIDKAVNAKSWDAGDTVILLPGRYDYSDSQGSTISGITGKSCINITKGYLTVKSSTGNPESVIIVGRGGETYISDDLLTTNVPPAVRAIASTVKARIESLTISNFYSTVDGVALCSKNDGDLVAYNCRIIKNHGAGGSPLYKTGAVSSFFMSNTNSASGGAIFNGYATNCVFIGNMAAINGGASCNASYVRSCVFVDNKACGGSGGATYFNGRGILITDSVFTNNSSTSDGGAVYFPQYPSARNGVSNCLFVCNSTKKSAGAVKYGDAFSSTFISNTAAGGYYGGAINSTGGNYASFVTNCIFIGNSSPAGGAIRNGGVVVDSIFIGNTSTGEGGAVSETTPVFRCYFTNNIAGSAGGGYSQGRYGKYWTISNCVFYGNQANSGGAISYTKAVECHFENNYAKNLGGAAYSEYQTQPTLLEKCNFFGNKAGNSGGAACNGLYVDCIFSNNSAVSYGGAGYLGKYENSKFLNNLAKNGGGLYRGACNMSLFSHNYAQNAGGAVGGDTRSRVIVSNCVIFANSATNMGGADASICLYNCLFDNNKTLGASYTLIGYNAVNCTLVNNKTINAAMTKSITTNCLFNGNIPSDIGGGKHWNAIYENVTGTPTLTDSRQSNRPLFNEGRDSRAHWYMPRAKSPARDSGVDHFYTESSLDADRKKRLNGAVDIGCFEYWPGGFATQLLLY